MNTGARKRRRYEKLATKIVDLRLEVENLNTEFQSQKSELDQNYKTKGARVAQLEAQIASEQMKKKQVLEKIKVLKKELKRQRKQILT